MNAHEEQLHGEPVAVTNVHVGTELVYAGPTRDWWFAYPPLPAPIQPNTRFWVKEIDPQCHYLLENGDHTITYWIGARQLLRFLKKKVLSIVPRARLDALRIGPRRIGVRRGGFNASAYAIDTAVLPGRGDGLSTEMCCASFARKAEPLSRLQ